jgi:hypothetical protein
MDAVMIACTDNNARGMIFLRAHERERGTRQGDDFSYSIAVRERNQAGSSRIRRPQ